ncbi:hypothetical protein I312_105533 [Cryptococcus bacillisporus CA1280]|uniref:uncharacterized protein n=1 Tax=Cryptococcus bacillisporus CA1280 TaxID=1296109 RepID=UPI003365F8BB
MRRTKIQMVQLGKHLQKSLAPVFVPKPCKFGFKIGGLSDSTSLTSHIDKSGLFEESSTKVSIPAFLSSSPKGKINVEEKDP